MDDQWDLCLEEQHRQFKEAMDEGVAQGVEKINEYLEEQENTPLNIAITGESGSGKSTFINALRGIQDDEDEEAAPTGVVETTTEVKPYPHPHSPNVTLWDLPGVGTTKFSADKYLELVKFDRFDFFIIISATRFTENDVKLAQEIKKMGKKFYFLRSKIDSDLFNEQKRKRNFNKQRTLDSIRQNCIDGLQGIEDPRVFLVSSFELHEFDFHLLEETLEKELPAHKRNAFLFALSNISKEIIKKKKDAYQTQIKYWAAVSVFGAAVPIPGVSAAVDVDLVVTRVKEYTVGFGIDETSLKRLAYSSSVPYDELVSVMTSQLGATKITSDLIVRVLSQLAMVTALMAAEEASRFFSFLGIPVAMCLSGVSTYRILNFLLDLVADDAQRVFEKAFKKTTEV